MVYTFTFTGRQIDLTDFKKEDIDLRDIAISLSRQNRYAGHTAVPWSVGQHSILCGAIAQELGATDKATQSVFLHDVAETWIQDIINPIKSNYTLGTYKKLDTAITKKTYDFFGLKDEFEDYHISKFTADVDQVAYIIESLQMIPVFKYKADDWNEHIQAYVKHLGSQNFSIPEWLIQMTPTEVAEQLFEIMNVWKAEDTLGGEISSEIKEVENM